MAHLVTVAEVEARLEAVKVLLFLCRQAEERARSQAPPTPTGYGYAAPAGMAPDPCEPLTRQLKALEEELVRARENEAAGVAGAVAGGLTDIEFGRADPPAHGTATTTRPGGGLGLSDEEIRSTFEHILRNGTQEDYEKAKAALTDPVAKQILKEVWDAETVRKARFHP